MKFISCLLLLIAASCSHSTYRYDKPRILPCTCNLEKFGHHEAEEYGLKFLLVEKINDTSSVIFNSDKQLELDAARKFALPIVDDFLHMLSECPIERAKKKNCQNSYIQDEPQVHKISLKIAFWDENVERPHKPYLAEILFSKGIFYYYYANPKTQKLKLVSQESYEETVKNTKYERLDFNRRHWKAATAS